MAKIYKHIFDRLHVKLNDSLYSICSLSDDSFVDEVLKLTKCPRNNDGEYQVDIYLFLNKGKLFIDRISFPNKPAVDVIFSEPVGKNDNLYEVFFKNRAIDVNDVVLVKDYQNRSNKIMPFYNTYDFDEIIFVHNGFVYDLSKQVKTLLNIDDNTDNHNESLDLYLKACKSFNLPFSFDDVLSFEDYFEFKRNNPGKKYGTFKA